MMPHLPPNAAGFCDTDPRGLVFIKVENIPKININPGLEPWKRVLLNPCLTHSI